MANLALLEIFLGLELFVTNVVCSPNGSRNVSDESELRILDGAPVSSTQEMPWIVNIINNDHIGSCTGALVHVSWTLTAGHCVGTAQISRNILIMAGYPDKGQSSSVGQIRRVLHVNRHPKYSERTYSHDIAVAKVDKPFQITGHVGVIPMSGEPWNHKEMNGRSCIAAGYGLIGSSTENFQLKKRSVTAKHGNRACHPSCFSKERQMELVCLTDKAIACHGDSGGPLVCSGKVVGVASSIYELGKCGSGVCENSYSAYIFVCRHLDFLSKHIPNSPRQLKSCRAGGGIFGSVGDDSSWDSASIPSCHIIVIIGLLILFINYQ